MEANGPIRCPVTTQHKWKLALGRGSDDSEGKTKSSEIHCQLGKEGAVASQMTASVHLGNLASQISQHG